MTTNKLAVPSPDRALAIVRGELTSRRRWGYRLVLLAASVVVAAIVSLWMTEPRELPLRLHVAFAALTAIGCGWIFVLSWILTRRNCPTALDRVATSWMATAACVVSLVVSLPVAVVRGNMQAALALGAIGILLLAAAAWLLRKAYRLRAELRRKLAELESQ